MTKSVLLLIVFTSCFIAYSLTSYAQVSSNGSEVPVFKSKADSAKYYLIKAQMKSAFEASPVDGKKADSLSGELMIILRTGISGYKKEYSPNPLFFPYSKLWNATNLDSIKAVSISSVRRRKFPKEILRCKNIEEIELVNTSINRLPRKLKTLSKLKHVYVYNNLAPLRLRKNSSVKTFTMRGEKEKTVPKSFHRFRGLEKLDLAQNSLTRFPNGTSKNKKLKILILTNNSITLDESIKPNPSLENLHLVRNKIKSVPAAIGGFTSLKKLTFNYNEIEKVAPEISKLQNLEELSFYNNKLTVIPDGVYQLSSVRSIDLYYNQIERLEAKLIAWKKLEVLYLANNQLISLPEDFDVLPSLQELYLHNNRLSFIPESVGGLPQLKILRINNNYISNLPESFLHLRKLENLDVSRNKIESVTTDFLQFDNLKILSLVSNPWNKETKDQLGGIAEKLRARKVVVHLNSFEESIDKN
jgi:Leucine-rich repeat (LRR) protein